MLTRDSSERYKHKMLIQKTRLRVEHLWNGRSGTCHHKSSRPDAHSSAVRTAPASLGPVGRLPIPSRARHTAVPPPAANPTNASLIRGPHPPDPIQAPV